MENLGLTMDAWYLLIGALAGILAGLFGVGGGLVVVPTLTWLFASQGVATDILLHKAVGTSLAVIVITSLVSGYAHQRRGGVRWPLFLKLAPALSLGALLGAWLADSLSSDSLRVCFSIFEIAVALYLGLDISPSAYRKLPGKVSLAFIGFAVGMISSLVGVGGGTLIVPLFLICNIPIRDAISTSAALAFPIALSGSLGFIFLGAIANDGFTWRSTYVDWHAFALIASASIMFTPLGVRLAHTLPTSILKKAFAALLAALGLAMFLF